MGPARTRELPAERRSSGSFEEVAEIRLVWRDSSLAASFSRPERQACDASGGRVGSWSAAARRSVPCSAGPHFRREKSRLEHRLAWTSTGLDIEKTKTSKADLVAAQKESFAACDKVYDSLTDAASMQMVNFSKMTCRSLPAQGQEQPQHDRK